MNFFDFLGKIYSGLSLLKLGKCLLKLMGEIKMIRVFSPVLGMKYVSFKI